jgi:aminoglycoside phosphotransferase family enzyme/predicted kinase
VAFGPFAGGLTALPEGTAEGEAVGVSESTVTEEPASVCETHVSILFLVGDRVYKLKKPVSLGFLDFSTREAREAVCHREVELNRRLTPDVYLGVADVMSSDGRPCDHLVVMRRMPAARRLATLVRKDADVADGLRQVAHSIAAFHSRAETSAEIRSAGTRDAILANWEQNFEQMAPFLGPVLDAQRASEVEVLARRYLAGRRRLFDRRIADGQVRDGHGDLLADDIFLLPDGPRILDCIEFSDRLRHGDVLADVGFLAMDLERLGAAGLAQRFLDWYREFSAENHPQSLAEHYIAYRAHVRSKVACLRWEQGDQDSAAEAQCLLQLSLDHLRRGRVRLVLVGGAPGTGKSTLAAALADRYGWSLLRSDEVRKDMAGLPHLRSAAAAYGQGLYTPARVNATYRELLRRARALLELGESVVIDASWSRRPWRHDAAEVASVTAGDLVEIICQAPVEVARARIEARRGASRDPSDASPGVAATLAGAFEAWPSAAPIDTTGQPQLSVDQAAAALDSAGR